jgi:trimethylamine:corrinoid methyltransferase-like protein
VKRLKKNLAQAAIGRVLSDAEKSKISASRKKIKFSAETRAKISATTSSLIGVPVIVKNIHTNLETEYINLTETAKAIGVSRTAVKKALDYGKILKKTYYVIKEKSRKCFIIKVINYKVLNYL